MVYQIKPIREIKLFVKKKKNGTMDIYAHIFLSLIYHWTLKETTSLQILFSRLYFIKWWIQGKFKMNWTSQVCIKPRSKNIMIRSNDQCHTFTNLICDLEIWNTSYSLQLLEILKSRHSNQNVHVRGVHLSCLNTQIMHIHAYIG